MKKISVTQLQKFDDIEVHKYLEECVDDLKEIDYPTPYPAEPEKYYDFVKQVLKQAQEYGLGNQKYAFSLMLAWHVYGSNLRYHQEIRQLLENKAIESYDKHAYLMNFVMEQTKLQERKLGLL